MILCMNKEKIGKFLCELRKEKKMTQEKVAECLFTSRENISKWERGVNMPTPDMLLELSKLYEISVNEILLGERKSVENQEKINNISLEVMREGNKKINKITKFFVAVILTIIALFFTYYFFNTYNTIHVFLISGNNENVSMIDGLAIFSKEKSYIKIGNITTTDNRAIDSIQFLFFDKEGNEHVIITSNDLNYTLTSINNYNQYFSYKDINYIKNNSYLRIYYENQNELIRLIYNEDMSNNDLFPNDNGENIMTSHNGIYNDDSILLYEDYFKKSFDYNRDEHQYYKNINDKNKTINMFYSPETYNITIFENEKSRANKTYIYNLSDGELQYEEEKGSKLEKYFVYNYNNKECMDGSCDLDVTELFLEKYLNTFK